MSVTNFYVTATENSYSTTNNTSSVTVKVYIVTDSTSYNLLSPSGTLVISGNKSATYSFSHSFDTSSTTCLVSKTFTVTHNDDGSGSITAKATFKTGISAGTVTASKTLTLTKIPRASTPSVSGTTQLGSKMTISTNRASSSFTHTIAWSWSGKSGTIATGVGASTTWTPAIATFAPYLTTGPSATCTITCTTYNGSTSIGSKSITFTLSIPTSVAPSVSSVAASDANGYLSKYGAYVKGKSSIKVDITASGIYGSTIKTYALLMDGLKGSAATSTLGAPPTAGDRTITAKVTDTRGRSASKTATITIADYSVPNITKATAVRSTEGVEDDESTTVRVSFAGKFTDINGAGVNTKTITVKHKLKTATTWTTVSVSNSSYTPSSYIDLTGFDILQRYDVQVIFADDFSTVIKSLTVSTSEPLMDFKSGGTGIAVGKIAEYDNLFDINKETAHRKPLKMDNGQPICYKNASGEDRTVIVHNASENLHFGSGSYDYSEGNTYYSGNTITLRSRGAILITSPTAGITNDQYGVNKILWSGNMYPSDSQTASLNAAISAQPHGIIVVFGGWDTTNNVFAKNNIVTAFIPKQVVADYPGYGHRFVMTRGSEPFTKYLYINNTTITGHADNSSTSDTLFGMTVNNKNMAMLRVIGV